MPENANRTLQGSVGSNLHLSKERVTPFEHLSINPLMPIQTAAWVGSRKVVTLFPLLGRCINTGNIDISLMEENGTRSVLLTLLSLEARFAIKISLLSTDAGTNLIKENLNPK